MRTLFFFLITIRPKIMRNYIFFLLASLLMVLESCNANNSKSISQNPNVIIILADDQGYGDLSCQGSPTIHTPNIDQLAMEGVRFTSFYSAGTVCAPSRRGLMTGRYAARIDADGNEKNRNMLGEEITLAELFKKHDYTTACLGKWHLGMNPGSHPNDQGFDYFYGTSSSNDHFSQNNFKHTYEGFKNATIDHFNLPLYQQKDTIEIPANQRLFTQRYTSEAVDWIRENKDNPFFLYIAHNMPHVPLFRSEEFKNKSYAGLYGDVIEEIDWSVGTIIETLKENNLDRNTLIVYSSDNGPWRIYHELGGSSGPFRNGKGTGWEGAYRVPGIFCWPGKIEPNILMEAASQLDLFATFSAVLGETLPVDRIYDSVNLLPMLLQKNQKSRRETFHYFSEGKNELWAVRKGKYKLHKKTVDVHRGSPVLHDPPLLFDLANDPAETHNIADENPQVIKELINEMNKMNKQLKRVK
jgi:arylsulfatase A